MKPKLPFIVFELTSVCNLNCRYCYNIWKRPDSEDTFFNSYRKAKKTIRRIFKIADVGQVTFSGGEPLLAERFSEIVLYVRMKRKPVAIISNGNAGSKESYQQLISLGASFFEFPIHSQNAETHDFMTRIPGSWNKAVQSAKQVLELNGSVVAVIVITKANTAQIAETLAFIQSLGINRVMLNRYNIGGNGIADQQNILPTKENLNEAFRVANETGKKLGMVLSSNVCTPLCYIDPENYPDIAFTACSSNIINKPLTVDLDGNMRICNHSPIVIGNIFRNKINDILSSPYLRQWTDIVPEFCSDCEKFSNCLGGCRAASEQMGFSLNHVDPILTINQD
ncbi:MAG: radical SAM protein [Bacteroidetes bacterium]|nr:radical SAM protein [Bacteroidota bacterium]MBU1721100.1 radical SAM protein [Bacteroidota bacterium]